MPEVIKVFQSFNNRELAIGIWLAITICFCSFHPKIRVAFFQLVKAFFAWKLAASYVLMFLYITLIILVLKKLNIWNYSLLPITVLWVICTAFVMLFDFAKAHDEKFFKNSIKGNLKGLVLLEFIINLYAFSLWIELILIPIFALFGGMIAIAEANDEYKIVKKFINFTMGSMGLTLIGYSCYMALNDFSHFASFENFQNFYLPILLSITFLPFVYFAALWAGYETLFIRLKFFVPDTDVLKYAKLKTIFVFNFNLWELNKWSKYINASWRFKSTRKRGQRPLVLTSPASTAYNPFHATTSTNRHTQDPPPRYPARQLPAGCF